jgi:CheY-like chemotaxis protein
MTSSPRVITVDPTWAISRIVRAAIDLMDRSVIQVDVPGGAEALEEVARGGYSLLITALRIGKMQGIELALRTRQASGDTAVVILADPDDHDIDEETRKESPFVYMRRPVDVHQFVRVLSAALDGTDVFAAMSDPAPPPHPELEDMGPVPALDLKAAYVVIDKLLTDVGAMAIVLSSRAGDVLLERGAVGYLDRELLTTALLPMVRTTINMGDLVGGQASALQFYDGDQYDVFVLSIGFHHFLCLVFDGQAGARQFGAVTRFGRRAAEDLKALLGTSAYVIQTPAEAKAPRKPAKVITEEQPVVEEVLAVKADKWEDSPKTEEVPALQLDPIENLDFSIFDGLEKVDDSAANDLFNPEKLAEIANEARRGRGPISYDEARELGIVP